MKRLFLEDKEVDVKNTVIVINKQINNIAELKDRQNNNTNKFILPFTPRNKEVMDLLGITGNQSRKPYKRINAKYYEDGEEMITKGYAVISKFDNKGYSVAIYDGNFELFDAIGTKKINELSLSDLNHDLTEANFVNSFGNTSGYIYGISDFGRISSNKVIINNQVPSIFVHTIWDKIFTEAGASYVGDIFNNYKFKNLVLTPKRGYNSEIDVVSNPMDSTYTINQNTNIWTIDNIIEDNVLLQIPLSPNDNFLNGGTFTIQEDGIYRLRFDLDASVRYEVETDPGFFEWDTTFANINNPNLVIKRAGIEIYSGYDIEDTIITLSQGDELTFYLKFPTPSTYSGVQRKFELKIDGSYLRINTSNNSVIHLNLSSFIGDLKQKDFVKDIMHHFGLMIQRQKYTNTYKFKRIQDVLEDKSNADDWSDYFNQLINVNYKLSGYAQNNIFAYEYRNKDDDKFADGILYVENENLKQEHTHIKRPYYACGVSDVKINNIPLTYTPFWQAKRDDNGVITKYKPLNSKNYLVSLKRINETITYGLADGNDLTYSGSVPRLHFSNLNNQRIIEENYHGLEKVLKWNSIQNATFLLNKQIVKHIDFFKLIYIRQLGSFFYLNKIKNFKQGKLTQCEIVKVRPEPFECNLTANPGSYQPIKKDNTLDLILDAIDSIGDIDTYFWEIISEPSGNNATLSNSNNIICNVSGITAPGNYTFKLTVSNSVNACSDSQEVIIIKLS